MVEKNNREDMQFIGKGKYSNTYKKDNEAYKFFKNPQYVAIHNLTLFLGKSNDLFVFPKELIQDSQTDDVIGYKMEYIEGDYLKNVFYNISIPELKKLIEKTDQEIKRISNEGIRIVDLHPENIMWDTKNKKIKIIDTDDYEYKPNKNLYGNNSIQFRKTLIQSMGREIVTYISSNKNLKHYLDQPSEKDSETYYTFNSFLDDLISNIQNQTGRKINKLRQIPKELQIINNDNNMDKYTNENYKKLIQKTPLELKILRFIAKHPTLKKLPFINWFFDKKTKLLDAPSIKVISEEQYQKLKQENHDYETNKMLNEKSDYEKAQIENKERDEFIKKIKVNQSNQKSEKAKEPQKKQKNKNEEEEK